MQRNKLENVAEVWSSTSYCMFPWTKSNRTVETSEGKNKLIKSANVRADAIEWPGRVSVAIRM